MTMQNCKHCGELIQSRSHDHLIPYEAYSPDYAEGPEDSIPVCSMDRGDAAADWARNFDADGEYTILNSNDQTKVMVREVGERRWTKMEVFAESVPSYFGHEVESVDG